MSEVGTAWPQPPVRARRGRDLRANLSSNELIHPAVPGLVERLTHGFRAEDLVRYPVQAEPARAAASLLEREPDEVLLAPGSDSVIRLIMASTRSLFGGRLVLQEPNYEAWTACAQMFGGWQVRSVAKPASGPADWLPAIRAAAAHLPPSVVALSWPSAPDGYLPRRDQLLDLKAICAARGHLLVVDGAYAAFSGDVRYLADAAGCGCLVLLSWSKAFGLAGGRLAVALGEPPAIRFLRAHRHEDHVNALMLRALTNTAERYADFEQIWADIARSREELRRWLGERGIDAPPSGANFLHMPMVHEERAGRLTAALSERGFRVRNMDETLGLTHHVRFTVACGETRDRFLAALEPLISRSAHRSYSR